MREMTRSSFSHSFKRFAQGAVAGLALVGLAACGGGGGGGSASPAPTTPEIPITPAPADLPAPTADQLAAATVISAGEPVDGTLESADDVKYYKLDVTERRMIEFTLDADEGIEIAILDSNGNVITTAETASEVMTRVQAPEGRLYARVRDKLKKGWKALNENKGTKALRLTFKVLGVAENIYNLIRRIPRVNLTIAGRGVIIDLRDYVRVSDGRTVTWTAEIIGRKGIGVTVEGTTVTLQASGEAVSGGFILSVKAYDPVVAATSIELIEGTVARRLPTLSDVPCTRTVAGECIHDVSIALGGTYTSRNVEDYFDYPAGTQIRFVQAATGTPRVEGWTHRIVDGPPKKLVVTVPSDPDADRIPRGTPPGDQFLIYLSATDPDGGSAKRLFSFTVAEEEPSSQPGSSDSEAMACGRYSLPLPAFGIVEELVSCKFFRRLAGEEAGQRTACGNRLEHGERFLAECPRTRPFILCSREDFDEYSYQHPSVDLSRGSFVEAAHRDLCESGGGRHEVFE